MLILITCLLASLYQFNPSMDISVLAPPQTSSYDSFSSVDPQVESVVEFNRFPYNTIKEMIEQGHLRDSQEFTGYERLIDQIGELLPAGDHAAIWIYNDLKRETDNEQSPLSFQMIAMYDTSLPKLYGAFEAVVMATLSLFLRLEEMEEMRPFKKCQSSKC